MLSWKQRGSHFSCKETRDEIGFTTDNYSEDNIITALEYYANLINLIDIRLKASRNINYQFYKEFYLLTQNIDILLEHSNYEKFIITEEEKVLLIPMSPLTTAAAETTKL